MRFIGNPLAYIGSLGQRRLPVPPWKWDRQGTHALLGGYYALLTGCWIGLALHYDEVILFVTGIAVLFLKTAVFVYYEDNEDKDINDGAWLDVGGFLKGFSIGITAVVGGLMAVYAFASNLL